MKMGILSCVLVSSLLMGAAGMARAEDDARVMGKLGYSQDHKRNVSLYLTFRGKRSDSLPALAMGDETRFYSKVWDGLYLQVLTESGERGTAGYMVSFSKDEEGKVPMVTNESRDVPSLREISAGDFRTDDNFAVRPLKSGPGTPEDRGALRVLHYGDFDVEIRVLEFSIGDPLLKKKPFFKSLACLVTVSEKASNQ